MQLKDYCVIDMRNTTMANAPKRYFPKMESSVYHAFTSTQGACVVLGVVEEEQRDFFFEALSHIMRTPEHPHHRILCLVISGNRWFPIGTGKSFNIANDELARQLQTVELPEPDYYPVVANIQNNLFVRSETHEFAAEPFVINVLQQKTIADAMNLIKEQQECPE